MEWGNASIKWRCELAHMEGGEDMTLRELFAADRERGRTFCRELRSERGGLYVDYSKTHVQEEDLRKWGSKLEGLKLREKVEGMFAGEKTNYTEGRAVLHTKLRNRKVLHALQAEGAGDEGLDEIEKSVVQELRKMRTLCNGFGAGERKGFSGKTIRNVVNIGIGGSDLGPKLLTDALRPWAREGVCTRYVSNVDAQEIRERLRGLSVEETLFVIVSKTFTTQETLENARIALSWAEEKYGERGVAVGDRQREMISQHFVAVSAAKTKAVAFGIQEDCVFDMWDFVGGRYSVWGCVGLSSALTIGFDSYMDFLAGGMAMDEHFRSAPFEANIPIMHALVESKYINEYGFNNKCVVPYDYFLELLPTYLQQCEMESNGKTSTREGQLLIEESAGFLRHGMQSPAQQTGAIIWGGVGTNVQHSYFQLLHQGSVRILAEFLIGLKPTYEHERSNTESKGEGGEGKSSSHDVLFANCLAQSRALMEGRVGKDSDHCFVGNRPSITVVYEKLSPFVLGMLLAMYEHKIFVQGIVWNINSFDQFGVELGKVVAKELLASIEVVRMGGKSAEEADERMMGLDSSTRTLLGKYTEALKCGQGGRAGKE